MNHKDTAIMSAAATSIVTLPLAATPRRNQTTNECHKRNSRLYQQSLVLEDELRHRLPPWALDHLTPALQGDVEAAESLVFAAPNELRGDLAVFFYLRQASSVTQRAVLGGAWSKNDEEVLAAAGSRRG